MSDDTTKDIALLGEIADLFDAVDPVPDDLADDARIAITVQALQAEIAEIVSTPLVVVRGDDAVSADTITFTSGALSLMVSVEPTGSGTVTIDGWVTAGGAAVEVHVGDDTVRATADEFGRFVVTEVPRGRTWFLVRRRDADDQPPVVTPAVEF